MDTPECREKHRRHVARVAKLVTKHIEAQHLKKPNNGEREQDIDLIVLPELAVHQDDLDVLIQLSRKTHAIIVAGLGFLNQPGIKARTTAPFGLSLENTTAIEAKFIDFRVSTT